MAKDVRCPQCAKPASADLETCPHCGASLDADAPAAGDTKK